MFSSLLRRYETLILKFPSSSNRKRRLDSVISIKREMKHTYDRRLSYTIGFVVKYDFTRKILVPLRSSTPECNDTINWEIQVYWFDVQDCDLYLTQLFSYIVDETINYTMTFFRRIPMKNFLQISEIEQCLLNFKIPTSQTKTYDGPW